MVFPSSNFAVRIIQVTKNDRLCWTGLLARRHHFTIADWPIFLLRNNSRPADSLDAVSAFLHYSTPPDRHFRVVHRLETRLLIICILIKIEPADFVRAIIRAKPSAHAAVIYLQIQPLMIVDGCCYRAHKFTRRLFAMHARYRHVVELGVFQAAFVISVHPDPEHFPMSFDQVLSDYGNIVLYFTCNEARAATNARREIDRHSPLIPTAWVFIPLVKGFLNGWCFYRFLYEIRPCQKFFQQPCAINLALFAINQMMCLGRRQFMVTICLGKNQTRGRPRRSGFSQPVCVCSNTSADAPSVLSSIAQMDCERVFGLPRHDPDGEKDPLATDFQFNQVAIFQSVALGQRWAHQCRIVPRELAYRFRAFLQPAIIRESSIPKSRVRAKI